MIYWLHIMHLFFYRISDDHWWSHWTKAPNLETSQKLCTTWMKRTSEVEKSCESQSALNEEFQSQELSFHYLNDIAKTLDCSPLKHVSVWDRVGYAKRKLHLMHSDVTTKYVCVLLPLNSQKRTLNTVKVVKTWTT